MRPPEATNGTRTASTTCGTSAMVPTIAASKSVANVPRWPPASLPWVTTASTPARSSASASSTVVAVPSRNRPRALIAVVAASGSTPKVKLKTAAPLSRAAASWASNVSGATAGAVGRARPSSA